jgi:hypothetical protein
MSPPEIWGPPIWTFFHTLAEKVNERAFPNIKIGMFFFIKRICNFLPCPECSQHARVFLGRINVNAIKDKNQFKEMLWFFHNAVNKRKRKSFYNFENVNKYKNYNLGMAFNNFIDVYHTKGNMNLIAESFQRSLVMKDLQKWLVNNHKSFIPIKKVPLPIIDSPNNIIIQDNNNNNVDNKINVENQIEIFEEKQTENIDEIIPEINDNDVKPDEIIPEINDNDVKPEEIQPEINDMESNESQVEFLIEI